MKIYVASSWRNPHQPKVVFELLAQGFDVYDFRNPEPGKNGFQWSEIDEYWQNWTPGRFNTALNHRIAVDGFQSDFKALQACDVCVLVLPCGRSAHLEHGFARGSGKRTYILFPDNKPGLEPELMYKMTDGIFWSFEDLKTELQMLSVVQNKILRPADLNV